MPTILTYLSPEPVTLAQAKRAARVDLDVTALDAEIELAISSAREQAEHITGRRYRSVKLRTELPSWPAPDDAIPVHQAYECAIEYWTGAAWVGLAAQAFAFGQGGIGGNGTVVLAPDNTWPALGARLAGPRVRIDLTAGPLVVLDGQPQPQPLPPVAPACVQQFICAHVAAWAKNPEATISNSIGTNPLYERLLDRERLWA